MTLLRIVIITSLRIGPEHFIVIIVEIRVGPDLFIVIIGVKVGNQLYSGLRSPFLGIKTAFNIC